MLALDIIFPGIDTNCLYYVLMLIQYEQRASEMSEIIIHLKSKQFFVALFQELE